jgi:hypothetical protein
MTQSLSGTEIRERSGRDWREIEERLEKIGEN